MKVQCHDNFAYRLWRSDYSSKYIDAQIGFVLDTAVHASGGGQLILTRRALFLSGSEMAKRMKISKSTYYELEQNDALGRANLSSLLKAARAMNCEFLYFFRPITRECYSKVVWNQVKDTAAQNGMYQRASGERKQRALFGAAKRAFANPSVARAQKWSQRRVRMFYESE